MKQTINVNCGGHGGGGGGGGAALVVIIGGIVLVGSIISAVTAAISAAITAAVALVVAVIQVVVIGVVIVAGVAVSTLILRPVAYRLIDDARQRRALRNAPTQRGVIEQGHSPQTFIARPATRGEIENDPRG